MARKVKRAGADLDRAAHQELILVVDDEELIRNHLKEWLEQRKFQVVLAQDGQQAQKLLKEQLFDLALIDLRMPLVSGLEVAKFVRAHQPETVVILMTAYGTLEQAVGGVREGAYTYITKPFTAGELELVMERAFERRRLLAENQRLRQEQLSQSGFTELIGESAAMLRVKELMREFAFAHFPLLISGQAGTGKKLVAKIIHHHGLRKNRPIVQVACSVVPANLLESVLFGQASAKPPDFSKLRGKIDQAQNGTIFFEEIQEITSSLQARLVRLIQDHEFQRLGGDIPLVADVGVMALTSCDLGKLVQQGRFRQDLWQLLEVGTIELPPLSKRRKDIPLLAHYFLERYRQEYQKDISGVSAEAMNYLLQTEWPGNVRQLANQIARAVVCCRGNELGLKEVLVGRPSLVGGITSPEVPGATIREMEKWLILKTLASQKGNRTKAAEILDISIRGFRNKIREYREEGEEIPRA